MRSKVFLFVSLFMVSFMMISCQKEIEKTSDTEAVYIGENDMAWAIAHYVEYPRDEMQFNRAGIVKVKFQVNEQGIVNEVEAVLDEEIKNAEVAIARKKLEGKEVLPINLPVISSLIKSLERLQFQPAKKNGKPINSTITTSVEFMLI